MIYKKGDRVISPEGAGTIMYRICPGEPQPYYRVHLDMNVQAEYAHEHLHALVYEPGDECVWSDPGSLNWYDVHIDRPEELIYPADEPRYWVTINQQELSSPGRRVRRLAYESDLKPRYKYYRSVQVRWKDNHVEIAFYRFRLDRWRGISTLLRRKAYKRTIFGYPIQELEAIVNDSGNVVVFANGWNWTEGI